MGIKTLNTIEILLFTALFVISACSSPGSKTTIESPSITQNGDLQHLKTYSELLSTIQNDYFSLVDLVAHSDDAINAMWGMTKANSPYPRPSTEQLSRIRLGINSGIDAQHRILLEQFEWSFREIQKRHPSIYDKNLLEAAFNGLVSGLDNSSSYISPDELSVLTGATGKAAIGIRSIRKDDTYLVVDVIENSSAANAGLRGGDLIVRLDDVSIKDLSLYQSIKLMRGEPGTEISVSFIRNGEQAPRSVNVAREIHRWKSIESRMLEPGYGYIRVISMKPRAVVDMLKTIEELQIERPLKGLVLDLRYVTGGEISGAAGMADAFLEGGMIFATKGRAADSVAFHAAFPDDKISGAPIVVLVNGDTEWAAEAVASTLQIRGRAVVIGTRTNGWGPVHTFKKLRNGGAIRLKTAEILKISGQTLQEDGVVPNLCLWDEHENFVQQEIFGSDLNGCSSSSHASNENEFKESLVALEILKDQSRYRNLLSKLTKSGFLEGGLYATPKPPGYSVFKILKVDEEGVHLRLFSNFYKTLPTQIDESSLFMAGADRKPDEPLGVEHAPKSKQSFLTWGLVYIQQSTVTPEELEGYQIWLESSGGYIW